MMPDTSIGKLRVWAILEGVSLIVLVFVCTPLKYFWGMAEPTQYIGAAHGALFLFYTIWLLVVKFELKWSWETTGWAFLASIIPGGTFVADQRIFRKYLAQPAKSEAEEATTDSTSEQ